MQEDHATALEIRILISIGTKLAARDLEQRLLAHGLAISSLQHGMLRLLKQHQYTISELSRKLALTSATLVPAVDVLERQGLVTRSHDPSDRRRTPLLLTESGANILTRVPAVDDTDIVVTSLRSLGHEDQQQLLALLRRLISAMTGDATTVGSIRENLRQAE
jgi:MarR family transcriptional regulator, organic hydroperoxide resistance regulator